MTTTPVSTTDFKTILSLIVRQFIIWTPIVVGIVHQFLMSFFGISSIYVVLNPPGYIYPYVTLEFGWWVTLTLLSGALCFLSSRGRIAPHRIVYPIYVYFVFLLIFVKPV